MLVRLLAARSHDETIAEIITKLFPSIWDKEDHVLQRITPARVVVLYSGDLRVLEHRVHARDGVVRLVSGLCDWKTSPYCGAELRPHPMFHVQTSQRMRQGPRVTADDRGKRQGRGELCRTWHVSMETFTPTQDVQTSHVSLVLKSTSLSEDLHRVPRSDVEHTLESALLAQRRPQSNAG